MMDQRRRRWADVVEMLYKCFVFAGQRVVFATPLASPTHLNNSDDLCDKNEGNNNVK